MAVFVIITSVVLTSNAQEIGVRFGGVKGDGGAAIDAIFGQRQVNRLHADLGFYRGGMGIDALWDFINRPLGHEAFNWYLGFGPSTYIGNVIWLGFSGELGLEYRFYNAPIAIGLDWRPTLWLVENTPLSSDSFGFNVRFVF